MTESEEDPPKLDLVGRTPPPRVLFVSEGEAGRQLAVRFAERIPTATAVDVAGFQSVWQTGFDLVVLLDVSVPGVVEDRIHVLQIGGEFCGSFRTQNVITAVRRTNVSHADAWFIPELSDDLEQLVRSDLLRLLPLATRAGTTAGTSQTETLEVLPRYTTGVVAQLPKDLLLPLVFDPSAQWFAAEGRRVSDGGLHWILPTGADPDRWLSYALRRLHEEAPALFPLRTGWAEVADFQTPSEHAARDRLAEIERQRVRLTAELEAEDARAAAELVAATQAAEDDERRLVTTQSTTLVAAVKHCLEQLGFEGSDSDAGADPSQLLEDLQVKPPGSDEVALVEVRGYKGGAAVGDLGRIHRFATNYAAAHSRVPERLWYVVNQFIGRVPADRSRPMTSHAAELEQFVESNGLVIDTADLLRLWLMVQRGDLKNEQARQLLWEARGVFELRPESGDTS